MCGGLDVPTAGQNEFEADRGDLLQRVEVSSAKPVSTAVMRAVASMLIPSLDLLLCFFQRRRRGEADNHSVRLPFSILDIPCFRDHSCLSHSHLFFVLRVKI